jgi:hypothetical protein
VLARITRQLLVVETHRLEDNLEPQYIAPLRPHFPVHEILGSSEWSVFGEESERRAVIAFAKDECALERGLARMPALNEGGIPNGGGRLLDG